MLGKFLSKTLLLLCFISALAFAAPPSFSEYDAGTLYKGASHPLAKIDTAGQRWDELRNNAAKKAVNFAGHYILFTGECGGGSICGEVIDAKTGEVVRSLPNAYKADDEETEESFDIDFRANSRLVVIMGVAQNREVDANNNKVSRKYRTRYYEFDGNEFHLVASEDR
ncbi:hypothetical protein F6R97_15950 [Pseudomonas sp. JV414]|uniref:hypothetical protein n=1 Tax=Pseudomonas sp. JV414 TaxID=1733110 RepID=UPI0028E178E9|nr:hypothetical protein [Pseudomonas sp. JV414]MDT9676067.1 hypothetical protein [Pseudomonas sp. JV414]